MFQSSEALGVNELFNEATACADLSLDRTLESVWIVSACHECQKKLRTTHGDKQILCAEAHKMRNNFVRTVL